MFETTPIPQYSVGSLCWISWVIFWPVIFTSERWYPNPTPTQPPGFSLPQPLANRLNHIIFPQNLIMMWVSIQTAVSKYSAKSGPRWSPGGKPYCVNYSAPYEVVKWSRSDRIRNIHRNKYSLQSSKPEKSWLKFIGEPTIVEHSMPHKARQRCWTPRYTLVECFHGIQAKTGELG